MRDVRWCVTVDYQQIENGNLANQIHVFTIDYGKFILMVDSVQWLSQSAYSICISILVEFYQWLIVFISIY